MWKILESGSDQRFGFDGRVACPAGAVDLDIDYCFSCSSMLEVSNAPGVSFVRCRGGPMQSVERYSGVMT